MNGSIDLETWKLEGTHDGVSQACCHDCQIAQISAECTTRRNRLEYLGENYELFRQQSFMHGRLLVCECQNFTLSY